MSINLACPDCPDGYVWTPSGQTNKTCPTCKGLAYLPGDDEETTTEEEASMFAERNK